MPITEAFPRDANNVPISTDGLVSTSIKTLIGSNTTVTVPIFTITGSIEVRGIWGEVTTVLGANNTAAYWRLNDGTTQSNITLNTGTTLSAAPVGSILTRKDNAGAGLNLQTSSQGRVDQNAAAGTPGVEYFSRFMLVAKNAVTTNIEFVYTTTDTPTSGVIKFYLRWLPIVTSSNVISL